MKAIATKGGYIGQKWYVDIIGQPSDRRTDGVPKSVARRAARLINDSVCQDVSRAIEQAKVEISFFKP